MVYVAYGLAALAALVFLNPPLFPPTSPANPEGAWSVLSVALILIALERIRVAIIETHKAK